jgi:pyruvate dehydrogenase (quinone)
MTAVAQALIKGDSSRWGVIKQGMKTKAQELVPGRRHTNEPRPERNREP